LKSARWFSFRVSPSPSQLDVPGYLARMKFCLSLVA
jgi:hypothetical protein